MAAGGGSNRHEQAGLGHLSDRHVGGELGDVRGAGDDANTTGVLPAQSPSCSPSTFLRAVQCPSPNGAPTAPTGSRVKPRGSGVSAGNNTCPPASASCGIRGPEAGGASSTNTCCPASGDRGTHGPEAAGFARPKHGPSSTLEQ